MSKEIDQGDHVGNEEARGPSAHSEYTDLSPAPFTGEEKEFDNIQASILPENEEEKSAETPESSEANLSDITQVHNEDMPPDHESPSVKSTEEKLPDSGHTAINEDRSDNNGKTSPQSPPCEETLLTEAPCCDENGSPSRTSPGLGASGSAYTPSSEEYSLLLEQLREERANTIELNKKLQMKLAPVLAKKTKEELDRVLQGPMHQESYDRCLQVLTELKEKMEKDRVKAERTTGVLTALAEEKLGQVEEQWAELLSLKTEVGVAVLSRCMPKADALIAVQATLDSERVYREELTRARLQSLGLDNSVRRLQRAIGEADRNATNPFQREYERLHARRTEKKKYVERQTEEALRVQQRAARSLQILSDVKKKIHFSETGVQQKCQEVAQVDAIVAQKREELAGIKHALNGLKKDNTMLKEKCGMLGNEVLLRDYFHTIQANLVLEEKVKNLKCKHADLQFQLGRGRKRPETM